MTHRTFRLGFERDICNSGLQLQLKDDYCDYWYSPSCKTLNLASSYMQQLFPFVPRFLFRLEVGLRQSPAALPQKSLPLPAVILGQFVYMRKA